MAKNKEGLELGKQVSFEDIRRVTLARKAEVKTAKKKPAKKASNK